MKKTVSLVLALLLAVVSLCTLSIGAFAAPDGESETSTTTAAKETTTEKKETTTEKKETTTKAGETTTKAGDTTSTTVKEEKPTDSSTTAFDDGTTTTKKPANVDGTIPNTGSGIVVPALALLAIAASSAIVIKSKKED